MDRRAIRAFLFVVVFLLVHDAAWSQDAAPLTGHVVDPHGDGVPNAEVTLSAAGRSRSVVTAPDGGFSFDAVPVGSFIVRVSAAGFALTTQTVRVQAARAPLTIAVALEGVREDVSVRGLVLGTAATGKPGNIYVQAGEVGSSGLEAELDATVNSRWHVNAGYGFTNAEFRDYEESPGVNLRGNTPVFAPRHTFNAWTGYDWSNGLGVNVGARYLGRTFADNGDTFEVDGYGVLNLAVRYRRGRIEYQLNVNNVTDTTYFVAHQDYLQVYPGNPANVLGTIRVRMK